MSLSSIGLIEGPDSASLPKAVHSIEGTVGFDYVANSVNDALRGKVPENEKIYSNTALPTGLRYFFSFTDPNIRNYFPGGYQGLAVSLMNIGVGSQYGEKRASHYIGNPVIAYIFQGAPFLKFRKRLSLNYEWNFGVSFGWEKYSIENDHFNLTVGSSINAYLNLSLLLKWQLNQNISLTGGVSLSHFSNGNTSWPNPGVNSMGVRLGLQYTINPLGKPFPEVKPDTVKKRKTEFDVSIWASTRKRAYLGGEVPVLLKGHYACAGLSFSPMINLCPWVRVGGAADLQWDESSDLKKNYVEGSTADDIKFIRPSFGRQLSVGLSAHGELKMPIFAVNIGIGYNFYAPQENRGTYQNITLKTYIWRYLFLNVGYQLRNFHQQACLMLGLGTTF